MCTVLTPEENGEIIDAVYIHESKWFLRASLTCLNYRLHMGRDIVSTSFHPNI